MKETPTDYDPLVSVVIPTYGRDSRHLGEALQSVFAQTYTNVEVIVVDDSPDPVALPDDPPVTVRRIRRDLGCVAAARNTGIEVADGDFLAFLDDDDRWRPEKLERQLAAIRAGGDDVGVVVAGQRYVDDADNTIGFTNPEIGEDATKALLQGRVNCAFSTLLVRASAAAETDGVDERFHAWEDLEWCLRLSESWKFCSVPAPVVVRRDGTHDQLTDDFEEMRDVAYPLFLEKHRPLAATYGPEVERAFVGSLSRILGAEAMDNGYYGESRRYFLRSLRHDPRSPTTYLYLLLSLGGHYTYQTAKYLKRHVMSIAAHRAVRT